MHKEGQRSPGATGTDDLARAPALTRLTQGCSATNELVGDERAALMPAIGQLCAYPFKHNVHSRLDDSLNSTLPAPSSDVANRAGFFEDGWR